MSSAFQSRCYAHEDCESGYFCYGVVEQAPAPALRRRLFGTLSSPTDAPTSPQTSAPTSSPTSAPTSPPKNGFCTPSASFPTGPCSIKVADTHTSALCSQDLVESSTCLDVFNNYRSAMGGYMFSKTSVAAYCNSCSTAPSWKTAPWDSMCANLITGLHPQSPACDAILSAALQEALFDPPSTWRAEEMIPLSWNIAELTEYYCGCTDHNKDKTKVKFIFCNDATRKPMCSRRIGETAEYRGQCAAFGLAGQQAACGDAIVAALVCVGGPTLGGP